LILGNRTSLEDHFTTGHIPLVKKLGRTDSASRFEFQSRMLGSDRRPIHVEIQEDNSSKSVTLYQREHDKTIFELWPYDEYLKQETRRQDAAPSFFTTEDLSYFSSVAGLKFKTITPAFDEIGDTLSKHGAVLKTAHWADRMREFGLTTEYRKDWQRREVIRYYTWARVFPAKKSPDVFFTIGVGSRMDDVKGRQTARRTSSNNLLID
jgi:hypothetical protein